MTGMPNSDRKRSRSMICPLFLARSVMFSARIVGCPQRDDIQNQLHASSEIGGIGNENDQIHWCFHRIRQVVLVV